MDQRANNPCNLAYLGKSPSGKFFLYGDDEMYVSADGLQWQSVDINYAVTSMSFFNVNGKLMFVATGKSV